MFLKIGELINWQPATKMVNEEVISFNKLLNK